MLFYWYLEVIDRMPDVLTTGLTQTHDVYKYKTFVISIRLVLLSAEIVYVYYSEKAEFHAVKVLRAVFNQATIMLSKLKLRKMFYRILVYCHCSSVLHC